jgi:hypothetical protein
MESPCEECLKYPICRSKKYVQCNDLNRYFNDDLQLLKKSEMEKRQAHKIYPNYLTQEEHNSAWDFLWQELYKSFPNLQGIYRE